MTCELFSSSALSILYEIFNYETLQILLSEAFSRLLAIPAPPRDGSLLALPLHTGLVYTRRHRHHHHIHHGS